MALAARAHSYPKNQTDVVPFPSDATKFASLFPAPVGLVEDEWPPLQLGYLGNYLASIGCKTIVVEWHYIDRDYMDDVALFYSRNLRSYPNYCYRLLFFSESFDADGWKQRIVAANHGGLQKSTDYLQGAFLGFTVLRPLPGSPLGRTVLRTFGPDASNGLKRDFGSVRDYTVHIAGFTLHVTGLAFQQQDQGVSACATTALWSALHSVARLEEVRIPTPANITEAASRHALDGGRSLPSEGLSIYQICEATRAAGLSPLLIQSVSLLHDKAQLLTYTSSGFAPVLAMQSISENEGHAVCAVGLKLGNVDPQTDPDLNHRDAATAVRGLYVHDDRLGPYAAAELYSLTQQGAPKIRTALKLRWPATAVPADDYVLRAIIVPLPTKLRLTAARMRALAHAIAESVALLFPDFKRAVTFNCRYSTSTAYKRKAFAFGLSDEGLTELMCNIVLSRYVGIIEISADVGPLFDVLLDGTETAANPSVLACVKQQSLPTETVQKLRELTENLGGRFLT